jgi:hypothetical protein
MDHELTLGVVSQPRPQWFFACSSALLQWYFSAYE